MSVSDFADVLWREAVSGHVSRRYPTIVQSDTDLGAALAMGELCFCETAGELGQHVHDGTLHVVVRDECVKCHAY